MDASDLTAADYRFPAPASVVVTPGTASVAIGATVKLNTTIKDANGNLLTGMMGVKPTWKSSDTTIAKVNKDGIVSGIANGTVVVTASASNASGTASVKVGTGVSTTTTSDHTTTTTTTTSTLTSTATSTTTSGTTSGTTSSTTTTTSTAPVSGTGAGLSGMQFMGDDFSKYASTADLMAKITANNPGGTGLYASSVIYTDGVNAKLAEIDPTVTYNGHATMKYNQPGGQSATPELWAAFPNGMTKKHVWFRAHVRFSPGYTTTGTLTNSSNAYKLFGWAWSGMDGSGRLEITNTTQYDFYWGMADRTTGAVIGGGNHSDAGQITTEWTDGAWYTYIIEIDFTASTSGVTRLWMARGNNTPTLRATTTGSMNAGYTMPLLNYICLGMNFNQVRAANQTQAIWYGDWEVVDAAQYANPFNVQ